MATEKKFLGTLGTQQLITSIRAEFKAADEADLAAAKKYADDLGVNYDAAGTAQTKVNELANGQVKTNTEHIGTMDNLETTAKSDLVGAINEVRAAVSAGGTAAAITMETAEAPEAGIAKAYTIKQGTNTIGTINIPSDMVVQSGSVVVDPEGQAAGTYIKLVLANATNDEIYVNVGSLVDVYKAKANAAQVQLAIDSATREISASIVAGSIGATELAANAVVTAKIADGNVTKAKLSSDVQASLDKADNAEANAKGYTDQRETQIRTDLTSAISTAEQNAKDHADGLDEAMGGRVKAMEDKVTNWDAAEQNAKDYADGLDEAMDTRVKALEDVSYVEITAAEVEAMFSAQ